MLLTLLGTKEPGNEIKIMFAVQDKQTQETSFVVFFFYWATREESKNNANKTKTLFFWLRLSFLM